MQTFTQHQHSWHVFSLLINPILGLTLLIFASKRAAFLDGGLKNFLLRVLAAMLTLWVLTHLDKAMKALRHVEWFPSGHMAFAVCVATSMAFLDRRTIIPMTIVSLLYAALMVIMQYHTPLELLTATLLAIPVTWLFLKGRRMNSQPEKNVSLR